MYGVGLSVIRQKGELKTEVTINQSTPNFRKNEHFLPLYKHTSKKYSFFGKFSLLCFLITPSWDSPFCLITNELLISNLLLETHFWSQDLHSQQVSIYLRDDQKFFRNQEVVQYNSSFLYVYEYVHTCNDWNMLNLEP